MEKVAHELKIEFDREMQVENMDPLCVVLKGSIHLATREIRFENLQTSHFTFPPI